MRILILGGAGFLGSNFARYLLNQTDSTLTLLDSLDPQRESSPQHLADIWASIRFIHGNILDERLMAEIVQGQDAIYHFAAQTSHTLSLQQPLRDAEVNCFGTLKVLEAVRHFNPKAWVIYPSSTTVLGKAYDDILDENHIQKPLDIYSANKGVSEKYCRIYYKVHGLKTSVLRFGNLYGPYGQTGPEYGFINYFIRQAFQDLALPVYGSGTQCRNVLYVDEASQILWQTLRHPDLIGEICQATGPFHHSILEIAQTIVRIFGRGVIEHRDWPDERKRHEIDSVVYSSEKLRAITGWNPLISLAEGLEKTRAVFESPLYRQ